MTTLFNQGIWKIIELFYKNRNISLHLRDISRKAGLNENSASRFLAKLEAGRILHSRKEANLKKYSLNKNNLSFAILSIFDVERFNKLPSIRKNAINYFLNLVEEKPIIVLLFGSTAKENYREDSDIDLLLIVNKKIDVEKAKHYAEAQTGINVNSLQMNYKSFLNELKIKEDKVVQSAVESGYPIFNQITFYQEVLK
jgi:predicted nucleotidyltransferase